MRRRREKSFYRWKAIESKFMLSVPKKPYKFMIIILVSFHPSVTGVAAASRRIKMMRNIFYVALAPP
jgi:hypothetical protein